MVISPMEVPVTDGVNVTVIVHEPEGSKVWLAQLSVSPKFPLAETELMGGEALPGLVAFRFIPPLVGCSTWLLKVSDPGDRLRPGALPNRIFAMKASPPPP